MNFIAGHHKNWYESGTQINPYTGWDYGLKCCLKSEKEKKKKVGHAML